MGCQIEQEVGEIEREVTSIKVSMKCPECGVGEMEMSGGIVLTTYPAQYPHNCDNCDYSCHYSGVQYPYIKHKKL